MKYRIVELLKCKCGSGRLTVKNPTIKKVNFSGQFNTVRCTDVCGFKATNVGDGSVTPYDCMRCYGLEVFEGALSCSCRQEYAIVRGIPRFLENDMGVSIKKTQKAFSWEWRMFRFSERNWGQTLAERRELFVEGIGVNPDELRGKMILDAGCGSGALSVDMAKSFGMEVVALDLALGIQMAYEHNDSPYVHFIQGSVLRPPLKEQSFDYLYSAGVLHHTNPDTWKAFRAIVPTLKKDGRCFIWLYHPIDKKHHPHDRNKLLLYNFIGRKITSRLPIQMQFFVYLLFIPLFLLKQKISCLLGRKTKCLTWREKMQSFFDSFSPLYVNRHTHDEATEWFKNDGFVNVVISTTGPYGFGVRGDLAKPRFG